MRSRFGSALLFASLFSVALSLSRCGKTEAPKATGPSPAEMEAMKKENETLKESLGQKTTLLNQVQEELDTLAKTGETVAKAKLEMEGGVKTREQGDVLRDRVAQAKKLLEERASRIKALQSRLKGSEAQLKQVMDLLTRLMVERADEVARLDDELGKLRGEKHAVEEERDAAKKAHAEEAARRQEAETALDTAYVAIGTEDELRSRGILTVEKKGVLGMKKRIGLAPITSYEPFQKISIQKDREFKLGKVKSYQAASGHDLKGGCTKEESGGETLLVVNDPKTFWTEKVLVVVVTR